MQDWTNKGKNKLVQNPVRGEGHWTRQVDGRKKVSQLRKEQFASGRIEPVRDAVSGKIMGTKTKC
jgi:hypothetical protein